MKAVIEYLKREPAVLLSLIPVVVTLLAAFGWNLSAEQVAAITAAVSFMVGVVTRMFVTPNVTVEEKVAVAQSVGLAAGANSPDYEPRHEAGNYNTGSLLVAIACIVIIAVGVVWLFRAF